MVTTVYSKNMHAHHIQLTVVDRYQQHQHQQQHKTLYSIVFKKKL